MKISLNWLRDYVKINADAKEYCDKMTMSGTKAEGYELLGTEIEKIVVGKITAIEKHPDADKLLVCKVDVGAEADIQIVTGAQNVFVGAVIPVCLDGAKLPDGKVIKAGKLRGVMSQGMLCSIAELGLTLNDCPGACEDGIFILGDEYEKYKGKNIVEVMMLEDTVVDFELTFNRPDCLGLLGIARETAATFAVPMEYEEPKAAEGTEDINDYLSVEVKATDLCTRYSAAMLKNVKIEPSPMWLRRRLRAVGVRPINNIVDITNYVMLEYGQPMHAFDYNYIGSKKIIVRTANEGETIVTLDGTECKLQKDMLCIADGEKPVALAGIMGGENSEIIDTTKCVVFESACFNRSNIRHTARALNMRTESSSRFEKGLPACNTLPALNRAMQLAVLLGAGEPVGGIIDIKNTSTDEYAIPFDYKKVNALLGISLPEDEMANLLKPLGFRVQDGKLIVPPFRTDMEKTADICEEVARLYGFDKIEATLFSADMIKGGCDDKRKMKREISKRLTDYGFFEIYTYSFISPSMYDSIRMPADSEERNSIKILNPLGEENSIMRRTALPAMLQTAAYNKSRHNIEDLKLFEIARVYVPNAENMADESDQIVIGISGKYDFYDIKGYVEGLLGGLNTAEREYVSDTHYAYHPGRCAKIMCADETIGYVGQLHPAISEEYGIPTMYIATLSADAIFNSLKGGKSFTKLPVFPSSERDLALLADIDIEAETIRKQIIKFAPKTLESVYAFDVYVGKGVQEGKKSIAFRLTFRHPEKTLNVEEVDAAVNRILKKLVAENGITLRE